jgi:hypothetical protein
MDSPLLLFGFLAIFHIIGAVVMARAVRGLRERLREGKVVGCQGLFLLIWATMFGGFPLLFGVQFARGEDGTLFFLLGQAVVWTVAFVVATVAHQAILGILEPFLTEEILMMLLGGAFLVIGVTLLSLLTRRDGLAGLLVGGSLALVGAAILGFGVWRLLKETR